MYCHNCIINVSKASPVVIFSLSWYNTCSVKGGGVHQWHMTFGQHVCCKTLFFSHKLKNEMIGEHQDTTFWGKPWYMTCMYNNYGKLYNTPLQCSLHVLFWYFEGVKNAVIKQVLNNYYDPIIIIVYTPVFLKEHCSTIPSIQIQTESTL